VIDTPVIKVHTSPLSLLKPGYDTEEGRFTAARGAKNKEELTTSDLQREVSHDRGIPETLFNAAKGE
jgi:hypothetical protein